MDYTAPKLGEYIHLDDELRVVVKNDFHGNWGIGCYVSSARHSEWSRCTECSIGNELHWGANCLRTDVNVLSLSVYLSSPVRLNWPPCACRLQQQQNHIKRVCTYVSNRNHVYALGSLTIRKQCINVAWIILKIFIHSCWHDKVTVGSNSVC